MACYHPIKGYRAPDGRIRFKRPGAPMTVSCGQCYGCRLERSRQWAVRIMHEAQMHEKTCWITLTYDQDHLPLDGSIDVVHFQKFIKSLRKIVKRKHDQKYKKFKLGPPTWSGIRYYHCGEYGEKKNRPHYHACLFGEDFLDDRYHWRTSTPAWGGQPYEVFRSPTLEKAWTFGNSEIGTLTQQSAGYTARYIMKKQTGNRQDRHYLDVATGVIRHPPYTTMSLKPGIGNSWYQQFHTDLFPLDECLIDGRKTKVPKYYDTLYEAQNPEGFEKIKNERLANSKKHMKDQYPSRLIARETVSRAQTANLKRTI